MNDDDIRHSGSRWEPRPEDATATAQQPGPDDRPTRAVPLQAEIDPGTTGATRAGGRRARRGLAAVVGVGLLAAGGLGGFALGHAAADDGAVAPAGVQTGTSGGGTGEIPDGHRGPHGGRPGFGDRLPGTDGGTTGTDGGTA